MMIRSTLAVALAAIALLGLSAARADDVTPGRSATQDMKDSAHSAQSAAVKTGRKTSHTVKKGVHKGADKVGEAADKVKAKTPSQ